MCAEPITNVCVLVVDINLPKHDGIEVLRAIRHDPALNRLRVIVLTGVATPEEESTVMGLGVRLYRGKPVLYEGCFELAREIAAICDEGGSTMTAAG